MAVHCTQCNTAPLEEGFLEDGGNSSYGYSRWIAGPMQRGLFGGARRVGKQRWVVSAFRCPACGHLELFASTTT